MPIIIHKDNKKIANDRNSLQCTNLSEDNNNYVNNNNNTFKLNSNHRDVSKIDDWTKQPNTKEHEEQTSESRQGSHSGVQKKKLKNGYEFIEVDRFGEQGCQLSPFKINLCTFIYSLVPIGSFVSGILLIWLMFTSYWYLTLVYVIYLTLNVSARDRGGQRFENNFQSMFWKYIAAYFPIKLRYSTEFKLDPNENYILNYSPHGISAFGSVASFATNALDFTSLFPGIKPRFMVHEMVFLTPFMREMFVYRGDCSVSSRSIDYMLDQTKNGSGNLLTIVAGGLQEADLSQQDTLKIVVMKRKGFIKKALVNGANLIPSIAFGENSVFTKVNLKPRSTLHHFEKLAYRYLGFKHPIYYGNGIMPFKRPITVVMGDPISVQKISCPSQEQIDSLHKRYLNELERLYEIHYDLRSHFDTRLELV